MKWTKLSALPVFVLVALVLFSGSCGEPDSISTKKAQLIANENMELRNQAESLKQEINKQKALLAKCESEKLNIQAGAVEMNTPLLEAISEIGQELNDEKAKNKELNEKIVALEAKLTKKME